MSHSVTVDAAVNFQSELKALDKLKNELNEIAKKYHKYFKSEINIINKKIKDAQNLIHKFDGEKMENEELFRFLSQISNVVKEIANLKYSMNYGKIISQVLESEDQMIQKIIRKYGLMAILCIEDLKNEGKNLTSDNIIKKIKENSQKQLDELRTTKIRDDLEIMFINSSLPEEIKRNLILNFRDKYSYQEIMDLTSFIETKISEFNKMQNLGSNIIKALEDIGFIYKEEKYNVTDNGNLETIIKAYKDQTKDFTVTINSQNKIHWQFGNYENHMCDADGKKFREESLSKFGIKTTGYIITRNINNSQPNQNAMAIKFKER